jgi:hypothetical protein
VIAGEGAQGIRRVLSLIAVAAGTAEAWAGYSGGLQSAPAIGFVGRCSANRSSSGAILRSAKTNGSAYWGLMSVSSIYGRSQALSRIGTSRRLPTSAMMSAIGESGYSADMAKRLVLTDCSRRFLTKYWPRGCNGLQLRIMSETVEITSADDAPVSPRVGSPLGAR